MTRLSLILIAALSLGLIVLVGSYGCASGDTGTSVGSSNNGSFGLFTTTRADDGDEAIALEDCPDAVQATIKAYMDGGTITELERTTDHGEVLYEVDVRGAEGIVEFDVAEDGSFRGFEAGDSDEDEDEEEIPLSDVPQVVKDAAIAAVPGIVLEEAERETENGVVIYDVEGEADGVEYEIEVTEDGVVNEIEVEDEDDDDEDEDEDDDNEDDDD